MTLCVGLALCLVALVGTAAGEEFPQCDGRAKGDYIPGRKGCRSFIFCSGDYSYEDSCPIGLYFNPESGICDDPANVPCQDDKPQDMKVVQKPEDISALLPFPEGPVDVQKRTPPGPTTTPVSPISADRPLPPTRAPPVASQTPILPEEPIGLSTAPPTLVPVTTTTFSADRPLPPTKAPPVASQTPIPPEEPIGSSTAPPTLVPVTTTTAPTRSTTTEWPNTNTTPSFELEVLKERCSRVMGGYFPYPNDCRHFFRCTEGKLIKQECATGYGWDALLKMCTTSGCSFKDAPIMNKNQ